MASPMELPLSLIHISISFCYGAYMGEVFRAGILSVPKGQTEAARSLGFNNFQTMTLVILQMCIRDSCCALENPKGALR